MNLAQIGFLVALCYGAVFLLNISFKARRNEYRNEQLKKRVK